MQHEKPAVNNNEQKMTEVFASQSLQIGFAGLAFDSALFDTVGQKAETVLAHQLSTGTLWEDIRMKGGAYGVITSSDSFENCFSFATYRDPNPLRSMDVIAELFKNSQLKDNLQYCGGGDEKNLVKSIIGCYAKEVHPRTNAEDGTIDFNRFLHGIEEPYRKRSMERLISLSVADMSAAFSSLGSRTASGQVIITGLKNAEQAAKALGTEVIMLPM